MLAQPASEEERKPTQNGQAFIGDPPIQVRSQVSCIVYNFVGWPWSIGETTDHRASFCESFCDHMKLFNRTIFIITLNSKYLGKFF